MKPWIIILIVALVILLIIGAVLYYQFVWIKNNIMDGPGMMYDVRYYLKTTFPPSEQELIGCEYRCVGGMENERYLLTLTRTEAGCELSFTHYADPLDWSTEVTDTYQLPAEAMETVQGIYRDRGIEHWPTLVEDDLEVLDAPDVSVTFTTGEGSRTISQGYLLPEQAGLLYGDVRTALEALLPAAD